MIKSPIAFHPGTYLKEELESRNVSQKDFAKLIGKSVSELNELINGKRNVSPNWALLLSTALGTSIEVWLRLQENYDIYLLKESLKDKKLQSKMNSIKKQSILIFGEIEYI